MATKDVGEGDLVSDKGHPTRTLEFIIWATTALIVLAFLIAKGRGM